MRCFKILFSLLLLYSFNLKSQISNLDRGIMIGNLVFEGYKALRGKGDSGKKEPDPNAKTVESFCFRNKLDEKITVRVAGTIEEEEIKKEFVIQKGEKECAYNVPKGVYSYEVVLSSKDIYQKGEYKVTEETQMTVNR